MGGHWEAPVAYSFVSTGPGQTSGEHDALASHSGCSSALIVNQPRTSPASDSVLTFVFFVKSYLKGKDWRVVLRRRFHRNAHAIPWCTMWLAHDQCCLRRPLVGVARYVRC